MIPALMQIHREGGEQFALILLSGCGPGPNPAMQQWPGWGWIQSHGAPTALFLYHNFLTSGDTYAMVPWAGFNRQDRG